MSVNKNSTIKSDGKIITQMFMALLPAQILSVVVSSLGGIINGIVIGNFLSPDALLALGFVSPLTSILLALASIISGGSRIMAGRYMGRSEVKKLDYIFTLAIILSVVVGGILAIACIVGANPVAFLLGASKGSQDATAAYVRGLALGFVPTILNPSLMVYLQMGNKSTYSFISAVILAASNLLFGVLNVTVFDGGIFGMGLATAASQIVTCIFLLVRFIKNKDLMRWDTKGIDKAMGVVMIKLGSPTAVAALLYGLRNLILNVIALSTGGENAVSALAIVNSVIGVFDAVNIGFGAVVLIIASLYFGEKDKGSLRKLANISLKIGLAMAFAKLIIIIFLGRPIITLFGAEGIILAEGYQLFLMLGINMPFNILTLILINEYQAFGRVKFVNLVYLVNAFIAPLGFAVLTKGIIGVWAIWLSYLAGELGGLIYMFFASRKRGGLLSFGTEFGKLPSDNITICNMEEVTSVAERIENFCKDQGIDDRRSIMAGLCLEEMARNVVAHGFINDNHRIDIYVGIDENDIKLRLRNNATKFNPIHSFAPVDPHDPCKNIGIRMVHTIAKDMNYQSSFGMNILSIDL